MRLQVHLSHFSHAHTFVNSGTNYCFWSKPYTTQHANAKMALPLMPGQPASWTPPTAWQLAIICNLLRHLALKCTGVAVPAPVHTRLFMPGADTTCMHEARRNMSCACCIQEATGQSSITVAAAKMYTTVALCSSTYVVSTLFMPRHQCTFSMQTSCAGDSRYSQMPGGILPVSSLTYPSADMSLSQHSSNR
jgi:hypothetical protein